jgi:uncharacterized protein (TIGR02270 family)
MGLIEDFKAGLYEEHLDEAGFLYEQRVRWREDPSLRSDDVLELEERLEAHLDGLFLGGELARARCAALLDLQDAGAVFGALTLYCRQGSDARIRELIERVVIDDALLIAAASEALCLELQAGQRELVLQGLGSAQPRVLAVWARVCGFQRLPLGESLLVGLAQVQDVDTCTALVWALGELRYAPAQERLRALIAEAESLPLQLIAAAVAALGKLERKVATCPASVLSEHPVVCLMKSGWGGERLLALVRSADVSSRAGAITALGLRGDPRSIPALLEVMATQPPLSAACARALHLLTGAVLLETVAAESESSADELDPDLANVEHEDDEAVPSTVRRLSQDVDQWQRWLSEHRQPDSACVRMGQPLGIAATVGALGSTAVPMQARRWLCDELRIRTGHELPLQPELPLRRQRALWSQLQGTAAVWSYPT